MYIDCNKYNEKNIISDMDKNMQLKEFCMNRIHNLSTDLQKRIQMD